MRGRISMNEMQFVTDVQIDLYGETQLYLASAKQGDKATRFLRVQLMNNGNEYQIPSDVTLIANIKKPDGKFCYNECDRDGNRVMVELTNQALAAAGTAYCDVEIRTANGEKILSSAAFSIEIEPSMRDEDAIVSSNEMTVLDKQIQGYIDDLLATQKQILDTETAFKVAESARAVAENERKTAESARAAAEAERVAAENIRAKNENERKAAESARAVAENERKAAESARAVAENDRKTAESARARAEAERVAAENIRVKNENERIAAEIERRQQLVRMEAATADANTAAGKATTAADRAETLYKTETELEETLTHVRDLYAQMEELKTGIAYIVDGGTPSSVDVHA